MLLRDGGYSAISGGVAGVTVVVVLFIAGLTALLALLIGLLVWGVLHLAGIRRIGRKVFRWTAWGFLAALVLVIFVGLPLLSSFLIAHSGTRPMDLELRLDPSTFGCEFREVRFSSRDGLSLVGWWMPGREERQVFVLTHGLFRDRKEVLERACQLNQRGHGTLVFDLRSHGSSQSSTVSMGYHERQDILGAVDWLAEAGDGDIAVLGVSMGAVAALSAARDLDSRVVAVIADSPFLSLKETVSQHVSLWLGLPAFPFVDLFVWNFTRINGFESNQLDVRLTARELTVPVLFVYGEQDERMPARTARAVFEAVGTPRKSILVFQGARHGSAWKEHPDCYIEAVEAFLEERELTCNGVRSGLDKPE